MIAIKIHSIGVVLCAFVQLTANAQDDSSNPLSILEARALPALPAHENAAFGYFAACIALQDISLERKWKGSDLQFSSELNQTERNIAEEPLDGFSLERTPLDYWEYIETNNDKLSWFEDNRALNLFTQAAQKPSCDWGGYRTVSPDELSAMNPSGYITMIPYGPLRKLQKLLFLRIRYYFSDYEYEKAFQDAESMLCFLQHFSQNNMSQPGVGSQIFEYGFFKDFSDVLASHLYRIDEADSEAVISFRNRLSQYEASQVGPAHRNLATGMAEYAEYLLSKPNGLSLYLEECFPNMWVPIPEEYEEVDEFSISEALGQRFAENTKELAAQYVAHCYNTMMKDSEACDLPFLEFAKLAHPIDQEDRPFYVWQARFYEQQARARIVLLKTAIDLQISGMPVEEILKRPTGLDSKTKIVKTDLESCFDIFHVRPSNFSKDSGYRLSIWTTDPESRSRSSHRTQHVTLTVRYSGIPSRNWLAVPYKEDSICPPRGTGCVHDVHHEDREPTTEEGSE